LKQSNQPCYSSSPSLW